VLEERPQVVGQFLGAAIALLGGLFQTFQTDRFQIAPDARREARERQRGLVADLEQDVDAVGGDERWAAGQRFIENGAEGPHIGRRPGHAGLPARLLRRHVGRRAEECLRRRRPLRHVEPPGEAEVGDLGDGVV